MLINPSQNIVMVKDMVIHVTIHHTLKLCRVRGDKTPYILSLGSGGRFDVSFMVQLTLCAGKGPPIVSEWEIVWVQTPRNYL
jgi:hypothetical protein